MNYLFLIFIALNCFAANWMPVSKINSHSIQAYELENDCKKSGEVCFDVNPEAVQQGFVSIVNGEMILDQPSYGSYLSQKQAASQLEAGLSLAESLRKCGGRVMDLMLVRNQPKNLSIQQVGYLLSTYEPIQLQLSSGSLLTAKAAIQAVSADGVIVTEDDKTALVSEIDKCLLAAQ